MKWWMNLFYTGILIWFVFMGFDAHERTQIEQAKLEVEQQRLLLCK